ncbi:DUF2336 domain-containing protein [Aestuariispira insulae]|uniref:Uncharacterized protein (DUF2336 family) n=1 Tax=Aestuariispira insulae TaxID=1461337 RepID=A0A3D9HNI6_9PROT|nr:DUF2336 domain-containing protein [Aestuariispira insulae]RED51067.1 uncharacterized protein (DUF2336 family) [Aestuariispira insulae]
MLGIDELLSIARRKSVEGRTRLAEIVTDLFLDEGDLTDVERALMFDILHKLVREVELSMRKTISEKLASLDNAPRDLIRELANDDIEVAFPLLTKSKALWDQDLIEVIYHRTLEHQLAISIRDDLSEDVSEALVATGEETVIKSLLENGNAKFARQTMEYLVDEAKRVNSFMEPLVKREDLPLDLAKKMYLWISVALRQHIVDKYDVDFSELDLAIDQASRNKIRELGEQAEDTDKIDALIDALEAEGKLVPQLMVFAMEDGMVSLFIAIFRRLTGLPGPLALRIVFEPQGEGLAIACKAIGVESACFQSLFSLSRKARPMHRKILKKECRKVLELYENTSRDAAEKVLRMWQCGSDYLAAIRQMEGGERAFTDI